MQRWLCRITNAGNYRSMSQSHTHMLFRTSQCRRCVSMEDHYILLRFFLFFERRTWRSLNGTQPNFAIRSRETYLKSDAQNVGFPSPKTWGPKPAYFGVLRRHRDLAQISPERNARSINVIRFLNYERFPTFT